ncbi:Ig-like domain (group 3) [Bacillus sp. OV166]|nr:Ig-like domain (group 3) [Bacillus sp. OV166]
MKRKGFGLFLVVFYVLFTSLGGIHAAADTTGGINYIKVAKANILSPNLQTVTVSLVDNALVKDIQVNYLRPDGYQSQKSLYMNNEGVFEGYVEPYVSTEGNWTATSLLVNYRDGSFKVLEDNDFGGSYELNGGNFKVFFSDTKSPVFNKVIIDKTKIGTGGTVTVTVGAEDDLSGIKNISLEYMLPNNSYMSFTAYSIGLNQYQYTVPSSLTSGSYGVGKFELVSLTLQDYKNNSTSIYDYSYNRTGALDGGDFTTSTDTTGPVLNNVSVDKTKLEPGGTVTVTVNAEDDLNDIKNISLEYLLPNNNYISFTAQLTGKNKYQYTVPSSFTSGSYGVGKFELASLTLQDTKNNSTTIYDYSYYRTGDLDGGDFITYTDTTGPVINKFSVNQTRILSGGTVTVTVDAVDDLSGINSVSLEYLQPNNSYITFTAQSIGNNQYQYTIPSSFTSGSNGLGKFELVSLSLADNKNNYTSIYDYSWYRTGDLGEGDFTVIPEANAPEVKWISVDKKEITNGDSLRVAAEVEDASGVAEVKVTYLKPDGNSYTAILSHSHDNLYEAEIPGYATTNAIGNWNTQFVWVNDIYGNSTYVWSNFAYSWGEDLSGANFNVKEKDIYPPNPPSVDSVDENSTVVSGSAEAGSTVSASVNGVVIGSASADWNGYYQMSIPKQAAKTEILVTATDLNGNTSSATSVVVRDVTPPTKADIYAVYDYDYYATGYAEPRSTVYVYKNGYYVGEATTNVYGAFSVPVYYQSAGTKLSIYVADESGNTSEPTVVTVLDGTAPAKPEVSTVTDQSNRVTGKAEAGSVVKVTKNGESIGTGTTNLNGEFTIVIPVQPVGTELSITATDKAGNVSEAINIVVKDATAPAKPEVNAVTDKDPAVSGKAEAGSKVEVKVNDSVVGTGTAGEDGKFTVTIPTQKAGTELVIISIDQAGNVSDTVKVVVKDTTAPAKPVVNVVTDQDTSVTGSAETGSKVDVKINEAVSTGVTGEDGKFTVTIPVQKAGTELVIIATDEDGNISDAAKVVVIDATAPAKPVVNEVTDKNTSVTGEAEPESKIEAKINGSVVESGTVGEDGKFALTIPAQKAGTELVITATDQAGNKSEAAKIVFQDATAPAKPAVNEVTDKDTKVTGEAEPGSKVELRVKGSVVESGTVGEDGRFILTVPVQVAGTELIIIATDNAGNVSESTAVVVKDVTVPEKPVVNEVTDKETTVTGKAEAGSKVEVKVNESVIGTGTAGEDGQYKVNIPVQKAGTELVIIATDKAGNVSETTTVVVRDVTAPEKPVVNEVTDKDTSVIGQAEAGSKVEVKVNGSVIGTGITGEDGQYKVTISAQKAGTELVIIDTDKVGNVSETTTIVVKDVTAPEKPVVNKVTDKDTTVTGQAEAGSKVEVKVNGSVIGTGTAGEDGQYKVTISAQKAGTVLIIVATDKAGNVSETTTVVVRDVTAPEKAVVNEVTDKDTSVTGKAEAGSKVEVKVNESVIGTGTAGKDGQYKVTISAQKAGTELVIVATDKAGNVSETTTIVVRDVTSPEKPEVNEVTDKDATVTGQAEAGSKVEVKVNESVIGTGTAGEDGQYKVTISAQKAGTELVIVATDKAGNVGETTTVVVRDVTAPEKAVVNEVTDKDTSVTGQAEAGSKVEVKVNDSVIGTGTAGEDGQYKVTISSQKAGTELVIVATDKAGNVSETTTIVVRDVTSPEKPEVNEVTDKDTTVTGQAEVGSKVEVKVNGSVIGTGTAGEDGQYKVTIPVQKAVTKLVIVATDKTGNESETTTVVVRDVTAPEKPAVNEVTDKDTTLTGQAEAGSKVEVKVNGSVIGTGTAGEDAQYKVTISAQKAGTELVIIATDKAGNVSETTTVVVRDVTGPEKPAVNEVTDKDTSVTGQAEAGSKVEVKVNGTVIGTETAGEDGQYKVTIPAQNAGTELFIVATDKTGNESETTTVVVRDVTAPEKPAVNEVTDKDTTLTGQAEAGSKVEVKVNGSVIGTGTAGEDAQYKVTISAQKAGTELVIIATDKAGNVSETTTVVVRDVTGPEKPAVNEVTDKDTSVTGQAEAGSKVEVKVNGTVIGTETAGEDGQYKVTIPAQNAGTELFIVATDKAGNVSETTTVVVRDITGPEKPAVNEVTDKDTSVTGQAEAGSKVEVKVNGTVIGTETAGEDGKYKVTIPAQNAGTELFIVATDKAGNVSETTTVVVRDITGPEKPAINEVTDKDTSVTGQAEAGSKVEVKVNGTVIGTGTAGQDGKYKVAIPVQKAGTILVIIATDATRNESEAATIKVIDKTAPSVLTVNTVSDKTKEVTGKTEAGATVSILIGTKIYAAKADTNGNFKVIIPAQKAGTKLIVTAKDAAGNVSVAKSITVLDKTAPVTPTVSAVSDLAKVVTGKAEAGAIVTVTIGTKKYIAKADAKGNYKVTIPVQKAGIKVIVTAKDAAGNVSVAKSVIVIDKTAPLAPKIKTAVKSTTKEVTGTAEAYSTITIKVDKIVIGTAKTDSKGNFKVKIKAQKKNTVLTVTATDKAKNVSKEATVKVK